MSGNSRPAFEDLPLRKGDPYLSAWGLYGDDDQLGSLNLLTKERVLEAAKEIKSGIRIGLDLPLGEFDKPMFNRVMFHHQVVHKGPRVVNDDIWTLNSQASTQWDGFRHFGYQKEAKFYNNITLDDIHAPGSSVIGIQEISKAGIVGRGVLLDFARYAESHGIQCTPLERFPLTVDILNDVAKDQNVTFKVGDIVLIRTGFTAIVRKMEEGAFRKIAAKQSADYRLIGVENSEKSLKWIWDNGFAAVGGDHPTFEIWPNRQEYHMHEVLLGGWGCPIGELFDLEKLAQQCSEEKRWTFFMSSEPCNVRGGVASPPNSLAIM